MFEMNHNFISVHCRLQDNKEDRRRHVFRSDESAKPQGRETLCVQNNEAEH